MTEGDDIEALARRQGHILTLAGISFLLWQLGWAGLEAGAASFGAGEWRIVYLGLEAAKQAGGLIFIAAMAFAAMAARRIRRRGAAETLDDELARANRARALCFGYFTMLALMAILLGISAFWGGMPAGFALHFLLALGVAAAFIRFGVLQAEADKDGAGA